MDERERATKLQIEQATELIQTLKYDMDWYDLEKMSREQLSELIAELKEEREGLL